MRVREAKGEGARAGERQCGAAESREEEVACEGGQKKNKIKNHSNLHGCSWPQCHQKEIRGKTATTFQETRISKKD